MEKIIQEIHIVANMYTERGFIIILYHRENEFDIFALRELIRHVSLNIFTQGSYITTIRRSIKTTKKGACRTTHSVTYKRYTNLMKISIVACIIHYIIVFPQKGSISKKLG